MREFKGSLDASGCKIAVVVARFNEAFTETLLAGAQDCLARLGADDEGIDVFWVPGSFELAPVARRAAQTGNYDAVICLGVLMRGATTHFDLVAAQAAAGIASIQPDTGVPAIFGVVTAENLEQAQERCGTKMGNRGWEAAQAAVEMINLCQAFDHVEEGASTNGSAKPEEQPLGS